MLALARSPHPAHVEFAFILFPSQVEYPHSAEKAQFLRTTLALTLTYIELLTRIGREDASSSKLTTYLPTYPIRTSSYDHTCEI